MGDRPNQREFSRVETSVIADVATDDGVVVARCTTKSLSLNGVFVVSETGLSVGTGCEIALFLNTGNDDFRLDLCGDVVREEPGGFAVEFTEVAVDSLEHLRNLVRYNAENADTVETEFHQHVGIKHRDSDCK